MTTIEPWHGGQVVVYREEDGWHRQVIDARIVDDGGMAASGCAVEDLRQRAHDRGWRLRRRWPGTRLSSATGVTHRASILYTATDAGGERWSRHVSMPMRVSTSSASGVELPNLKWYENVTK